MTIFELPVVFKVSAVNPLEIIKLPEVFGKSEALHEIRTTSVSASIIRIREA